MNKFLNTTKIGFIIQGIALVIMIALVLISNPIPDIVMWMLGIGYILTVLSSIIQKRNSTP